MQILICGAGRVGGYFIKYYSKQDHDLLVVDISQKVLNKISKSFDVQTFLGDASSPNVLSELDIDGVEMVIAATSNDNANLIICKLSSILFPGSKKIVRINNINHGDNTEFYHEMSGDLIFFPEREIASFLYNAIFGVVPIPGHETRLFAQHRKNITQDDKLLQLGIIREDNFLPHSQDDHLADDTSISIGSKSEITHDSNIVIIGGSKIGIILAKKLLSISCTVSIIEPNHEVAKEAASTLPDAEVIHGSPVEYDILIEAGVGKESTVVTTTENDQINLVTLLLAHNIGCKNIAGIINIHTSYIDIAKSAGILGMRNIGPIISAPVITALSDPYIVELHKIDSFYIVLIKIISDDVLKKVSKVNLIRLAIIRENEVFFPGKIDLSLHDELIALTEETDFTKKFI